jgi:hypothetical protein
MVLYGQANIGFQFKEHISAFFPRGSVYDGYSAVQLAIQADQVFERCPRKGALVREV